MNIIEKFRDTEIVKLELEKITSLSKNINRKIVLMEVCGTHTVQISRFGLRKLLPSNIDLISGPGCPVCVTPKSFVDKAVYLVRNYKVIGVTFSDLFRVPGSTSSLEKEKSDSGSIEIVYSPVETINIAEKFPDRPVVFFSIGFETTLPGIALIVKETIKKSVKNLFFLLGNKLFLPALETLIMISRNFLPPRVNTSSTLDGFILPGHLSSVIGEKSYRWIAEKYNICGVITGFEPVDIVRGIRMMLEMIHNQNIKIQNEYTRVVKPEGNLEAKKVIEEVFIPVDTEWRGLGCVPDSGVKFKEEYSFLDVENNFEIPKFTSSDNDKCRCAEVLIGKIKPYECNLFSTTCTPENPLGACMVSSEGSCAAYYKYEMG